MSLLLVAFIAGVLTALAPCVLPLMPVIVGGSLTGGSRWRPYIIVVSLAVSLFGFTLALKATTVLLGVPPVVWSAISGGILVALGIATIWPHLYEVLSARIGFYGASQRFLGQSSQRHDWLAPVLMGAALGPVFASCSPTYALIIATVLPAGFALGVLYLSVYTIGLAVFLLLVALVGRTLTSRLGWALNPEGWFKRVLGVLFVLIGLAVITGFDKTAEAFLIDHQLFDETKIEQQLLPKGGGASGGGVTQVGESGAHFSVDQPIPAPEITGITDWINSKGEKISDLKGKVVLIDFWTYSCINCIHTLPHVTGWYEKYKDQGLVVIGVHAPEFAFEHVLSNVQQAVKDDHITYPVGLDNDLATWRAFNNQYWPAEYFIDRQGKIRHYQFGEGEYDNDERVIRALLAEGGGKVSGGVDATPVMKPSADQSPETYLGYERADNYANLDGLKRDIDAAYSLPGSLDLNHWALGGNWRVGAQDTVSGPGASLRYNFTASQVYLVMGAGAPAKVHVLVNGQPVTATGLAGADVGPDDTVTVGGARLYRLVKSGQMLRNAALELQFPAGVSVNAFTFDS